MSTSHLDAVDNLESLLDRWAGSQRLTDAQASAVHKALLLSTAEPQLELDADWFWGLLRPVTALLDGPNRLNLTLTGLISVGA